MLIWINFHWFVWKLFQFESILLWFSIAVLKWQTELFDRLYFPVTIQPSVVFWSIGRLGSDFIWSTHINSKISAPKSKSIFLGLFKPSHNFILLGIRKAVVFITLSGWRLVIELNTKNFTLNYVEFTADVTVKLTPDIENDFVSLMSLKFSLPPSLFNRSSCAISSVIKFGWDPESGEREYSLIGWRIIYESMRSRWLVVMQQWIMGAAANSALRWGTLCHYMRQFIHAVNKVKSSTYWLSSEWRPIVDIMSNTFAE